MDPGLGQACAREWGDRAALVERDSQRGLKSAVTFRQEPDRGCHASQHFTIEGGGRGSASLSVKNLKPGISGHLWNWKEGVPVHDE